jgi:hypothetical protein
LEELFKKKKKTYDVWPSFKQREEINNEFLFVDRDFETSSNDVSEKKDYKTSR